VPPIRTGWPVTKRYKNTFLESQTFLVPLKITITHGTYTFQINLQITSAILKSLQEEKH
jgi:hypothetical protein